MFCHVYAKRYNTGCYELFALRVSRWGRFNRPIANSPEGTPKANFVSKNRLYDVVSDSHKPSVRLSQGGYFN